MERLSLNISYVSCAFEDLSSEDAALVVRAKEMCEHSYAPYSKFCVGAAVSLDNGEVVCGSNQENAVDHRTEQANCHGKAKIGNGTKSNAINVHIKNLADVFYGRIG